MTKSSSSVAWAVAGGSSSESGRTGGAGAWDIGLGASVVLNLGSGSGLGGTLSIFAGGVLTLGGVVVFLGNADGTVDIEGSLGNFAVLLLVGSSGGGFGNLSLVGDGVLVWDHDVLGTDVSVGSSGLRGELGVRTGSFLSGELSVLATDGIATSSTVTDGTTSRVA